MNYSWRLPLKKRRLLPTHVQHLQGVVGATIKKPRVIYSRDMPKRARVDEADGATEALARATKAAINKHGWDELQLAYRTGRLRFLDGVGAKAAAEIALRMQAKTAERSHWQCFMDLVQPHLNSDWMKRLATWNDSGVVDDILLRQVQVICAFPQYANSALLRAYLSAVGKKVREYEATGQEPSWPLFATDEARAKPYEYLCKHWGLSLRMTDKIATVEQWWGAQSSARRRAYLEEGLLHLIQTDGHTVCGRERLFQWCMEQLENCPKAALLSTLSEMLQEGHLVIGLRGASGGQASQPDAPPDAIAYQKVYAQECAVAHAVAQLMSECPCHMFDDDRGGAVRATLDRSFAAAGRCSPDDAQWEAIRGLYNSTLSVLQGPAGTGKTDVVLRGLAELLLLSGQGSECADQEESSPYDDTAGDAPALRVCVLAAAPTHAARQRLEESLGVKRGVVSCDGQAPLLHQSRVLASWLYRWKQGWENCKLAQVILNDPPSSLALLVDESSMVDLRTWHELFEVMLGVRRKIPSLRIRCVLTGDHNQLPPVGVGTVFEDLCTSGVAPVFELRKVYRQEAKSILSTAELYTTRCPTPFWTMKNGYVEPVLKPDDSCVLVHKLDASDLTKGIPGPEVKSLKVEAVFEPRKEWSESRRRALQALLAALQQVEASLRDAGIPRENIQLVTFTNELCYLLNSLWTLGSIDEAERLLSLAESLLSTSPGTLAAFLARRFPWKPGDPVVFKKNSHSYYKNNDEGIILAPGSDDERRYHANAGAACVLWTAQDVAQCVPEDDESDVLHVEPGATGGTWRLTVRQQAVAPRAARTIHSVQGMGFDAVVYVLLKPSEYLRANGHYTSITRARKKVCLLGDLQAFGTRQARAKEVRQTLLPALLRAILGQPTQSGRRMPQLPAIELEKVVAQAHNRASQRTHLPKAVRLFIWDRHIGKGSRDGPCCVCGNCIKIEYMHAAHVVAVANGGTNHVDNLRPCCPTCNLSMGVRNLDEFRREFFAGQ